MTNSITMQHVLSQTIFSETNRNTYNVGRQKQTAYLNHVYVFNCGSTESSMIRKQKCSNSQNTAKLLTTIHHLLNQAQANRIKT